MSEKTLEKKLPKPSAQKLRYNNLINLETVSDSQRKAVEAFDSNSELVLIGSAGTGKTFLAMHLALDLVMEPASRYDKVIILRSVVPVRDIGFLPGDRYEKEEVYTQPYQALSRELFPGIDDPWKKLVSQKTVEFVTTSYIRGITFRDCILIVDEMQNMCWSELNTVMTRIGENCRVIFCGDFFQSDFDREKDRNGLKNFMKIIDEIEDFAVVVFTWNDIVRSDIVKRYIMAKEKLKNTGNIDIS